MILEGLVSTANPDGTPHLAPMGPRIPGPDFARFVLRPFPTSTTYQNLLAHPEGVLHITDDVLLMARAALGALEPLPTLRPAERTSGWVLVESCRYYEFVVRSLDTSAERATLEAEVLHVGRNRDFWGFNRAKHAVLEAAILATRFHILSLEDVAEEFRKFRTIVMKTGGEAEREAMDFLERRLRREQEVRQFSRGGGNGMTRVTAPARLHFGLFHVPRRGETGRVFGGVGLMIGEPALVVSARSAETWQIEGPLASRAQFFAQRLMAEIPSTDRRSFQVLIERCPPEHVGLGVGTQLGLAVARALAEELSLAPRSASVLAEKIGRGERSAVGVHGFDRGGLIIESGKLPGEAISPLLAHAALPDHWRIVLFLPSIRGVWHGGREQQAFERERDPGEGRKTAEQLNRLALFELLPAAVDSDFEAFSETIHEFNRQAGTPFAVEQGGPYSSREVEELIEAIRRMGIRGVGQSSWGPTVFAFVESEAEARAAALAVRGLRPDIRTVITQSSRDGASVSRADDLPKNE